jgi:high-affinity iron transporter
VLSNFLIGLREGLEAALVVGILVAYLVKSGNRARLPAVWTGVGVAVLASLGVGFGLSITSHSLSFRANEGFGGTMSLIAVVFVTGMIFWMRRQAHRLKGEIQDRVADALVAGSAALALTAFLAVGREGLETALFLWAAGNGNGAGAAVGAVAGLLVAVVAGWLVYKQSLHLNLALFFKITGAALIVVVAGVLAYGLHDLQEATFLPGIHSLAFDVRAQIPPTSWYGTVLKGIFNFSPDATWLQVVAYFAYLVPTMLLFFRPVRRRAVVVPAAAAQQPARASALVSR